MTILESWGCIGTIQQLREWGEKVCPSLKGAEILGTYSGLRPATEHRDYQIIDQGHRWITVAGIRSTGLTASPAIAEYVADMHEGLIKQQYNDNMEAFLQGVTAAATTPLALQRRPVVALTDQGNMVQPLPTL